MVILLLEKSSSQNRLLGEETSEFVAMLVGFLVHAPLGLARWGGLKMFCAPIPSSKTENNMSLPLKTTPLANSFPLHRPVTRSTQEVSVTCLHACEFSPFEGEKIVQTQGYMSSTRARWI